MEGAQLRDEAAQDRVRAATEFLDPSKHQKYLFGSHCVLLTTFSLIADTRERRLVVIYPGPS